MKVYIFFHALETHICDQTYFSEDTNQNLRISHLPSCPQLCNPVINIHVEGTMSQIFYIGLTFYFMSKNGKPKADAIQ